MAKTVLKAPIITEKSMAKAGLGRYTFEVEKGATKPQIKKAVQQAFGVDVLGVWTVSLAGKKRRMGRRFFETPGKKKAVVQIDPSQKIEGFGEAPVQAAPTKVSKEKKEEKT